MTFKVLFGLECALPDGDAHPRIDGGQDLIVEVGVDHCDDEVAQVNLASKVQNDINYHAQDQAGIRDNRGYM